MERVRFIEHGNKKVLLIDATRCSAQELLALAASIQEVVTAQPRNSVLTLTDFTGAQFDHDTVTRLKEAAAFDRPYVRRGAIVGAQSMPKVLLESLKNFAQRDFGKFESRQEALAWLVQEK